MSQSEALRIPGQEWAEQSAESISETMEFDDNLADAAQNAGQTVDSFRGIPPSDTMPEVPVSHPGSGPVITPVGQPSFGLEYAIMAGAVLAMAIAIAISRLFG